MAPTTGCVFTIHEKKLVSTSDDNAAKEEKDTTVVKAWLRGPNTISGMQMTLSKNGANFPTYVEFLQKALTTNGSFNTGFNTTLLSTNAWTSGRFMFYEPSSRALLFDKVSKAIGNGNEQNANAVLSGDVANFKDSFSIRSLDAANISGRLISLGTDVFTNMNKNDNVTWSSKINSATYNSGAATISSSILVSSTKDIAVPTNANTLALPSSDEVSNKSPDAAIKLPTNNWGAGGMTISEVYMVQGNEILSVTLGTIADAGGIDSISYTDSGDYSLYSTANGFNQAANTELKFMSGQAGSGDPGYTAGQSPQFYLHIDNSNLTDSEVVQGKYILKATPYYFDTVSNIGSSTSFVAAAGTLKAVTLSITKMSTSFTLSHESHLASELTMGAKIKMRFKVSGGLNSPYAAGGSNTTIGSSSNGHIFCTDVRRKRTDNKNTSGVLYAEELESSGNGIDIITEKLAVASSNLDLYDQYGIYFNSSYEYSCRYKNTITGEETTHTVSVTTKPGQPQNFQDQSVNDLSGFFLEWNDPLATGGVSKTYKVTFSNIKFTGNNYNKDGTQEDGNGTTEITYNISKTYTNISPTSLEVTQDNLYYPGVALTANVKGTNSAGDGNSLSSTSLTCLEAPSVESTAVTFLLSVCQNPIQTDAANNLPDLSDTSTLARNPSGGYSDANFPAYSVDSFGKSMTHANVNSENANFVVLTLNSYAAFTVAMYDVYVDGKKFGSLAPSAITNNKIIISGVISTGSDTSKSSLSNESVHAFSIIARDTTDVTDATKHSKTSVPQVVTMHDKASMPKPAEAHSLSISPNSKQNRLTVSVTIPANSFVSKVEFYKVPIPGTTATQAIPNYSSTVTEVGSSLSAWSNDDLNTVDETKLQDFTLSNMIKIKTQNTSNTSEHTITFTQGSDNTPLRDNELYAIVAVTYNQDEMRSGNGTPVKDGSDNWDYTGITTHFASTSAVDTENPYSYSASALQGIIAQSKTLAPVKSSFNNVSPNGNYNNNFQVSSNNISPISQFSIDDPIQYKLEYTPESVSNDHSDGSTSFSSASTVIIRDFANGNKSSNSFNTSNEATWKNKFSKQLTGKVKITSRTDMRVTSYDPVDYTNGESEILSSSFTTKSATYVSKSAAEYDSIATYGANNKPCLKAEELVLTSQDSSSFVAEFQKFRAITVTGVTSLEKTCPPSCMPLSKLYDSGTSEKTTFMKLSSSQTTGIFAAGDCLTIYNKDNGATLDTLIITSDVLSSLTDDRSANFAQLFPGLTYTQGTGTAKPAGTPNCNLFYSIWKSDTKTFFPLEIESFSYSDSLKSQYRSSITLTANGSADDGEYNSIKFKLGTMYVDFFEEGIYFDTKEVSAFAHMSNISPTGSPSNYENVTASLRHATDADRNSSNLDESNPNIIAQVHETALGSLIGDDVIYSLQSMATKVIYDASSTELYLNNDSVTQTIVLQDNVLNYIAFTVVDTTKTTVEDLFGTIIEQNSSVTSIAVSYTASHSYTGGSWDSSGTNINYEYGYYIRINGADVNWQITGKTIRGLKVPIAMGLNYLGHPFATTDGKAVFEKELSDTSNYANYWGNINVITDKSGTPYDLRAGINLADYPVGNYTFTQGDGYILAAKEGNSIELGTMAAQGLIGDFNIDGIINEVDVTIYKEFLAATNPGYSTINGLPSIDEKFELGDYNGNDILDIGDAVILASKVAGEAGFEDLTVISNMTTYAPSTYNGDSEAVKSTATLPL